MAKKSPHPSKTRKAKTEIGSSAVLKLALLKKALVFLSKVFSRFVSNRVVYRVTGSRFWVFIFIIVVLLVSFYLQSGQPSG